MAVGVADAKEPAVVSRKSSKTWSDELERSVRLVIGFAQPVTSVCGELPDAVVLTSGFPLLLKVN